MAIIAGIKQWIADLSGILFPRLCEVCDKPLVHGEDFICLECRVNMPLCDIHRDNFNSIHQRLMRKVPIERAAAYFHYHRESPYTNLIMSAKYRGRPIIIRKLSAEFARKIKPDGFFDGIDAIIPVPMHPSKKHRRGYNQAEILAMGLHDQTALPILSNLIATRPHSTQTRKNAYRRWLNAQHTYKLNHPEQLTDLHILLVDDVITTGSTLMACCEAIHSACPSAHISILTLAATQLQ